MKPEELQDEPLYNSRIVNNYIKLIKSQYSYINIEELLNYAGMELYQVEDEGHWFSQNQINKFHQRLKELTGNQGYCKGSRKVRRISWNSWYHETPYSWIGWS